VDIDPDLNGLFNPEVSGPGALPKIINQEPGEGVPVNINTAPKEVLTHLPGIGEVMANTIVLARDIAPLDFKSIFDLDIPAAVITKLWVNKQIVFDGPTQMSPMHQALMHQPPIAGNAMMYHIPPPQNALEARLDYLVP
jgi:hypothetical protein